MRCGIAKGGGRGCKKGQGQATGRVCRQGQAGVWAGVRPGRRQKLWAGSWHEACSQFLHGPLLPCPSQCSPGRTPEHTVPEASAAPVFMDERQWRHSQSRNRLAALSQWLTAWAMPTWGMA